MLLDTIQKDMIEALKAKDPVRVSALRGLISELKNHQIDLRAESKDLDDTEALKIVLREAKKRRESIEIYTNSGRKDLADKEAIELTITEEYLPKQLSREEVEKIVQDVLSGMDGTPAFGDVMKAVMPKVQGLADGKVVSEVVKSKISG